MPDSGFLTGITRPGTEPSTDKRKGQQRATDYPYDMPVMMGAPRSIDSSGAAYNDIGQMHGQALVPKDTTHTPWDDDTGNLETEAGSPVMWGKSAGSGGGSSVPGAAGGWADGTRDNDMDDEFEHAFEHPIGSWSARSNNESRSAWSSIEEIVCGPRPFLPDVVSLIEAFGLDLDLR